ncbi:UvrD-helicase domain-containing protein [Listeria booriae]|uniref:ATP-dependent helicase n=1 Tax=Listeria booriae TaxID=1552123 RepID=UPI001627CB63|nr:ATP-dependent helicase [Listeria booriae]MBC1560160.1 UvrD-helicase domain-containing protein [Listeria booriae]
MSKVFGGAIINWLFSHSDEKMKMDDKITTLEEDNEKLLNQVSELEKKIEKLLEDQISNKEEQKSLNLIVREYKSRFGTIKPSINLDSGIVGITDEDANVFHHLVSLNGGNEFNKDQVNAIRFDMKTHLRIIAGAGSGKTQTICAKAAYLVLKEKVRQRSIVMCTFSAKAKQEMEERVTEFLGGNSQIGVLTFHGWFQKEYNSLIQKYPHLESYGIAGEVPKKNSEEENHEQILNRLIKQFSLYNFDKYEDKNIKDRISYWRNMGYTDSDIISFIERHFDDKEILKGRQLSVVFSEMLSELEKIKRETRVINFDDMLFNLKCVLENDSNALKMMQSKYKYIFIDEFQDINPLQKQVIELICPPDSKGSAANSTKLIIVGDDDQSIYFFRGAEPRYIKEFDTQYNQTSIELMTNYRSIAPVVHVGNTLITNNQHDRIQKSMVPHKNNKGDCYVKVFHDEQQEASWIAKQVLKLAVAEKPFQDQIGKPNFTETIMLYPNKNQLKSMIIALQENRIPFVTKADDDLLGVFGINFFKQTFNQMMDIINAETRELEMEFYKKFIINICSYYYISFAKSTSFVSSNANCYPDKIAEFICSSNKYIKQSEATPIKKAFEGIKKLMTTNDLDIKSFVAWLVKTPKVKKDLIDEEKDWLLKEIGIVNTLQELINKYKIAVKLKEDMSDRLREYNNNNYNALCLLTIHSSKGLGYKNVFVKGIYKNSLPDYRAVEKNTVDLQPLIEQASPPTTMEEQRRLMYVAFTRAKENLYVTYPRAVNDKPTIVSQFINESNIEVIV